MCHTGATYEGAFKANNFHGHGRMRYPNGDSYEGEWADDKRHGNGTLHHASGQVDEGEWRGGIHVAGPGSRTSTRAKRDAFYGSK